MKRLGNIWTDVIDEDFAVSALVDGVKHKKHQKSVQKLLNDDHTVNLEKAREYVRPIIEDLKNGTYTPGDPICKRRLCKNKSNKGKWRDLYVPSLRDHVVHHMLIQASIKAFTRGMHPFCCGSVPGRGIKWILKYVEKWVRYDKRSVYFVKLDIKHFFDNINPEILKRKLSEKIKDKKVLKVFNKIIDSSPTACPIGFYTSPWFANLYLEKFDWYVVQNFNIRHYLRYMDDMLLISHCKRLLEKLIGYLKKYLHDELGLEIKNSWEIKAIGRHRIIGGEYTMLRGTDWLDIGGYKFCKDATILRDGIFLSTKREVKKRAYSLRWCRSVNSVLGWASHSDSHNFTNKYVKPYVNIKRTKRVIRNVDKNRKWRKYSTA